MMIYVVMVAGDSDDGVSGCYGVFSTREKAQNFVNSYVDEMNGTDGEGTEADWNVSIDEKELDAT